MPVDPTRMMHMHHERAASTTATAVVAVPASLPCACTTLRKAARAVTRLYDGALAGAGMNANQLSILRALNRAGPQPLSRLAETLVMDRTSLYRALRPMERSGWVVVEAASSGRSRVACLTDEGRVAMDRAAAGWESAQAGFVGALGSEAWEELAGVLQGLVATASEVGSVGGGGSATTKRAAGEKQQKGHQG